MDDADAFDGMFTIWPLTMIGTVQSNNKIKFAEF